ncbi:MAG: menaquinone biosynthesis decarboxylase [Planctomycetota bacterium]
MRFQNLREFTTELERRGWLVRVAAPVSRDLEITAIVDRVVKHGGPALLFEQVEGCAMPVLINAFGSAERTALALGAEGPRGVEEIGARIERIVKTRPPQSLLEKLKLLPLLAEFAGFPPRSVKRAPVQETVIKGAAIDLNTLPALTCWPKDGGRFFTYTQVITTDPESGARNNGMYRVQILGRDRAAMHWQVHHDAARHHQLNRQAGRRMPVCIAIGGDPCVTYAASAPLPPGIDEMFLAGFLRGRSVAMAPAVTQPMQVPAEAEIVIEGYVEPEEFCDEGPFGDHTGFYTPIDRYPVLHVTAITHRREAIFQAIVVGKPPMEDTHLGKATERIFRPLIALTLPEAIDYDLPEFGVFHNANFVQVRKMYPWAAKKVASAIWGLGQMMFSKWIVCVDPDCPVHDPLAVLKRVAAWCDFSRDLLTTQGPADVLDHAAPRLGCGGKASFDATRKTVGEGYGGEFPAWREAEFPEDAAAGAELLAELRALPNVAAAAVAPFAWRNNCVFVAVQSSAHAEVLKTIAAVQNAPRGRFVKWLTVFDAGVAIEEWKTALFYLCANSDLVRDLQVSDGPRATTEIAGYRPDRPDRTGRMGRIAIDATSKRDHPDHHQVWPEELRMSAEIEARVDGKMAAMGLERWM